MVSGISLANKCQLLFGVAVLVIVASALSVPWIWTQALVRDSQADVARQLSELWLNGEVTLERLHYGGQPRELSSLLDDETEETGAKVWMTFVKADEIESESETFIATALNRFQDDPEQIEYIRQVEVDGQQVYRYARAIRQSQLRAIRDPKVMDFSTSPIDSMIADPLAAILIIDRISAYAESRMLMGKVYIITSGIVALLLAVLVFNLILTKLILSPVRHLRETTEKVQGGDLTIRSQIKTGDEFEQLAEAFNTMLDRVEQGQAQLRTMNESLDLKVNELAEVNIGLYESNRFKSEFLAGISHELRTPLNSIIGFAELLEEVATSEMDPDPKRKRYLDNILTSGRSLLEMINELLNMAKIEAGRMEVNLEPTSVGDVIEGLLSIIRPQAQSKQITLEANIGGHVPMIETDPGKLQQILYNFLSNAIKFSPEESTVVISAERITRQDNTLGVRISVVDNGPGIPDDMQDLIFEKFRQIDSSHTRQHTGTGLGLAICRELAEMLSSTVSFTSEPGQGATFFVDLPFAPQPKEPKPLMA